MYRMTVAVGITLASLALSACSSGSSSSGSTRSGSGSSGIAAAPRAGSTAPAAPHASSGAAAGQDGASVSTFCSLIGQSNKLMSDLAAGDIQPGGVSATNFKHDLEAARAAAPAEIKSDMDVIVDFDESLLSHPENAQETPALTSATEHYAAWIGSHCAGAALSSGAR